ncbi:histidinol-phosphate transaminase [Georgenia sp. 10Sc9-8]|uniref:Aromatic amino acid aminotransferase n=1 Tax=Georgenia halotolerans TaxID=3028317 RepID=A0ABT5U0D7_9MICO|nr:histidinol-phosphate transaminase [Georgenia halotolerans]
MPAKVHAVRLRPDIASLPAYVPGARTDGHQVYKLSSNENPHPPLPGVLAAMADAAQEVNRYPDMYATDLVEALGERFGVGADRVVTGNGSVAVLAHMLSALCAPGDEVVYAWRSFEAYPIAVQVAGARSVRVPVDATGRHDLPAMAAAITDRTRAVILCSPNNPTGPALRREEVLTFLDAVPRSVLVVLDEAYVEFVQDPEVVDGVDLLREHKNVVVLRTFSKAYGLAGLRVGFALGRRRLIRGFRATSTPFGVNALAQAAAVASLRAEDELLSRVAAVVAERDRVTQALAEQGWSLPDAQGNFVWLPIGRRARAFADEARSRGVLVRAFDGEGVRVSVGEADANAIVLELAREWLSLR